VGGQIFIAILLLVVLFGALNTVLMSVVERARELRMMLAVGMTPGSLGRMVAIETGIMLLIGMVLGHIIAAPINLYLAANPIYFTGETAAMIEEIGWEPMVTSQYTWLLVGSSTLMMAAIGLVVVLWPLKRIYQIRTIKERE
jgi:ABC-type antimicrobial peptide transport system permease subunit